MITSPDNPKLKLVRRLRERSARRKEGLFASDGEDLLAAGLVAGWEPVEVLTRAGTGGDGLELGGGSLSGLGPGVARTEVEGELLDRCSTLGSGTRVIAIWEIPAAEVGEGPCVFLDAVSDPGNVGTIIRSAAGLVGGQVLIGEGSADPWGPKAVRASMGAVFANAPAPASAGDAPRPLVGIDAHGGGGLDATLATHRPATLCLGAEREGLSSEVAAACDGLATISLQAGAESLNVAAAAAIALQRLSSLGGAPNATGEVA